MFAHQAVCEHDPEKGKSFLFLFPLKLNDVSFKTEILN